MSFTEQLNGMEQKEELTLKQYQAFTRTTAIYPKDTAIEYLTLGLVGEAGEIANKIKKVIRDSDSWTVEQYKESREEVVKELGDVFWYLVRIADEMGKDSEDIIKENMVKLQSRKERGTISGNGDNR